MVGQRVLTTLDTLLFLRSQLAYEIMAVDRRAGPSSRRVSTSVPRRDAFSLTSLRSGTMTSEKFPDESG